jgi:putrescine transport system permease protein
MLIFSKVKLGITPDINALAALIIGVVTLVVSIAGGWMFAQQRQALVLQRQQRAERP